jgi:hypothetical protein
MATVLVGDDEPRALWTGSRGWLICSANDRAMFQSDLVDLEPSDDARALLIATAGQACCSYGKSNPGRDRYAMLC